jgi:hypothetical protein
VAGSELQSRLGQHEAAPGGQAACLAHACLLGCSCRHRVWCMMHVLIHKRRSRAMKRSVPALGTAAAIDGARVLGCATSLLDRYGGSCLRQWHRRCCHNSNGLCTKPPLGCLHSALILRCPKRGKTLDVASLSNAQNRNWSRIIKTLGQKTCTPSRRCRMTALLLMFGRIFSVWRLTLEI